MHEVPIHLHIEPLDEGGYVATSPDVPGLVVQADTIELVLRYAPSVVEKLVESDIEHGYLYPRDLQSRVTTKALSYTLLPVHHY